MSNTISISQLPDEMKKLISNPHLLQREINNRSFYEFVKYFWSEISTEKLVDNWHIKVICDALQRLAERVSEGLPLEHDILLNVPPGSSKTTLTGILFPAWCWSRWYWMKIITASYSNTLALEPAEVCRDLIKSDRYQEIYPEIGIKGDKDQKSNFRVIKSVRYGKGTRVKQLVGGARFSTSVGGTLTGMHCHIWIVDDPLSAQDAISKVKRQTALHWMTQTLSLRKINKETTAGICVMQRLHPNDPAGHLLKLKEEKGKKLKHYCFPAELGPYGHKVRPFKYRKFYTDGLFDVNRMPRQVLLDALIDLGQYGYAGQMGQDPAPPSGGMFKVDMINIVDTISTAGVIKSIVRYWDKAATKDGGAFTAGIKIAKTSAGKYIILDVKRGQWVSHEREQVIKATAEADGRNVSIWIEQEPGSGGKESAEQTIRMLDGYVCKAERSFGNKIYRADPFSVRVNLGDVYLIRAPWNSDLLEEMRLFPYSTYKDQIDAAGAGYAKLNGKKEVKML